MIDWETMMFRTLLCAALLFPVTVYAEDVTVDKFVRAESDHNIRTNLKAVGADVGELIHQREPVTAQNQTVIRSNQDTLYSPVLVDLSRSATITLPACGQM
jgi:hypothetical protein